MIRTPTGGTVQARVGSLHFFSSPTKKSAWCCCFPNHENKTNEQCKLARKKKKESLSRLQQNRRVFS